MSCIITDPSVVPSTSFPAQRRTKTMLKKVLPDGKLHFTSQEDIYLPGDSNASSLFFWTAHYCYANHHPMAMDPNVLWYVIMHEVATAVKQDPKTWAHIFTSNPDTKQIIRVVDNTLKYPDNGGTNNWGATIQLFESKLGQYSPNLENMLPKFSNSTAETKVAHLVAFMDAASPFYDYRVQTMCGIPAFRLEGEEEDWALLLKQTQALADLVPTGDQGDHMRRYFQYLIPMLAKLHAARCGESDIAFWQNAYKLNHGSGGPHIHGWITQFLAFIQGYNGVLPKREDLFAPESRNVFGGIATSNFPAHVSKVDFIWEYYGREIPMFFVAGVMGVVVDNGFLAPRLGYGVLEKM